MKQGIPSTSLFLIREGEALIKRYSGREDMEAGGGLVVGRLAMGAIFGEISFLLGTIPGASVEVASSGKLSAINISQVAITQWSRSVA